MKKSLSIIMSLLLAVQPAFGVFEGVKKKVVSVKEAMVQGRKVLKENWQCFRSGTGPNCTKEQRSALRIIQDFVSGKWAQARAGLKNFYAEHREAVLVTGTLFTTLVIVPLIIGGSVYFDLKRKRVWDRGQLRLEKGDLDTLTDCSQVVNTLWTPRY